MSEILGDLRDGGEWRFADDSDMSSEPIAPASGAEELITPAAIEGPQDLELPQCVLTCDGDAIWPRVIGSNVSNEAVNVPRSLLPANAVFRVIGDVVHVQRTPGPRQLAVLDLFRNGLSSRDISTELGMAFGTVTTHLRSLRALGLID